MYSNFKIKLILQIDLDLLQINVTFWKLKLPLSVSLSFVASISKVDHLKSKLILHTNLIIFYRYMNKNDWIVGLLHIFNEFSEFNGSSVYNKGIMHFEEILFHIEMMISNFSYLLAEYFIKSLNNLIEIYNPNHYPSDHYPDKKQIIANHFLVWNKNPIKIWVLIVYILNKLQKSYPDLKVSDVKQKYINIVNFVIDNWEDIWEVERLFNDKWLNGWEVIDLVCYENIEELLSNQAISLIITDIWYGPFYRKSFMTPSTWYQLIASKVLKPNSFYEYLPNRVEEISEALRTFKLK